MKLPYCSRCNQPRTPEQLRRGICGACRRHRCEKHQPGTPTCYKRDKCRCDDCRNAYSDQTRKQRHYKRTGRPARVSADIVKAHYARLQLHLSPNQIEKASGLSYYTIKNIPHAENVHRKTAEAILSVPIPVTTITDSHSIVPSIGAQRRIQALVANGWSMHRLVTEMGTTHGASGWMSPDRDTMHARTYQRVATMYGRLWDELPPERDAHEKKAASRARNLARARGWLPPMAWDDGTGPHGIDNPQATPYTAKSSLRKAAEMVEELRHIIDTDTPENIARRLGYANLGSLSKTLDRIGEHALARRIDQGRRAA